MQSQRSTQFLENLMDYLQDSKDQRFEQMPEVLAQAVSYERRSCYINLAVVVLGAIISIILFLYFFMYPSLDKYGEKEVGAVMAACISAGLTFIFFIQVCRCVDKLVKIKVAPKYFLLQLMMNIKL